MDKHNILDNVQDFILKPDHDAEDTGDEQDYDIAYDNLAVPEIRTGKAKPQHDEPDEKPEINYNTAIPEVHVKRASGSSQAKNAEDSGA